MNENKEKHGFGIWMRGAEKYTGSWKKNKRHGYGESIYLGGYVYNGKNNRLMVGNLN
jgi:hypothetical protein